MPELHKLQRGRHVIWTQSCMKLLGFKVFRSYGTVLKALAFWCFKTTLSKVFENLLMPLDPFVLRLIVEIIILQGFFQYIQSFPVGMSRGVSSFPPVFGASQTFIMTGKSKSGQNCAFVEYETPDQAPKRRGVNADRWSWTFFWKSQGVEKCSWHFLTLFFF